MLVSVIIPIYNVEKYMDECVRSIVNQTYSKLQIILVDDGSPDTCPQKCDEWRSKDDRIIVLHKNNGGLSSARNYGIDYATGNCIFFVDSDDFIERNTIKSLVEQMNKENADIVSCGFKIFENNDKKENTYLCENPHYFKGTNTEFYMQIISNHACGKLYKKHLFQNIRFPEGRNYEDIATTHRLYYKADKIVYSLDEMYFYRMHSGTITAVLDEKNILDIKWAYEGIRKYYEDKKQNDKYNFYMLTVLFTLFSRVLHAPNTVKKKLNINSYIKEEFRRNIRIVNIYKYKKSPFFIKILLFRLHLAKPLIYIRKVLKDK